MTDRSPVVLFAAKTERWEQYEGPLRTAFDAAGLGDATLTTEADPAEVDYIIYAPNSGLTDFTPFTRLKAVLNLWAGVEDVTGNPTLNVPLARMVDDGLTEGMVEWVTGHVLRHHLGMDTHIHGQDGVWRAGSAPPLARDRTVAVLGLGVLGAACARALSALNFRVLGWSRSAKSIDGIETAHGEDGLDATLRRAEIVVLLLPDTPATENTLNARTLALVPRGAVIVNPGRGPLIDDDALLQALDSGQVGHATLDVFRTEPLPPEHPYWAHPRVTVTPHIASETRPISAARVIAENIRRGEAGEPFLHLVDRGAGY
ncbi:MAG: bifunctional glyoxylate/hydroxypyruvate reductase GhrA [Rhodobacteraceae bacterium HLUCCO18]|nr:MAG: bifunctional glyoxylate/hydroxypyruvate reductase GhrA [Rhodobacteraceae bacterium HLUCCO18]